MDYIESVLDGEIDEKEVARISRYSFALFARLFSILTGYTLGEYLRFRKLSRAAADLRNTNEKVIDIALNLQRKSSGTRFIGSRNPRSRIRGRYA